jgi:endoplasmic reticulum-Golgi intermediate compartment protein 3
MEDVKVKTRTGAFCMLLFGACDNVRLYSHELSVTLLSAAIILAITTIEFFDYRRVNVDTSITVDKSRGEKLNVRLNVTFPRVPCYRK